MALLPADWGILPASALHFGFSIPGTFHADPENAAKAVTLAKGRSVRIGFGWKDIEPFGSTKRAVPPDILAVLEACARHALIPYPVFSYGPDVKTMPVGGTPTLTAPAKEGDTILHVSAAPVFEPWKLYVAGTAGAGLALNAFTSGGGCLMVASNPGAATVQMATPLTYATKKEIDEAAAGTKPPRELPIGYMLNLKRCLYDPIHGTDPLQEGAHAFSDYVRFGMREIAAVCRPGDLVPEVRGCVWNEGWTWDPWGNSAALWSARSWDPGVDWSLGDLCSWHGVVYRALGHMTQAGTSPGPSEPPSAKWAVYAQPARAEAHLPAAPDDWRQHVLAMAFWDALREREAEDPLPPHQYLLPGAVSDIGGQGIHDVYAIRDSGGSPIGTQLSIAEGNKWIDSVHNYGENPNKATVTKAALGAPLINNDYDQGSEFRSELMVELARRGEGYAARVCATECGSLVPASKGMTERKRACYNLRRVLENTFQSYIDSLLSLEKATETALGEGRVDSTYVLAAMKLLGTVVESLGADGDPATVPTLTYAAGAPWQFLQGGLAGTNQSVEFIWQDTALTVPKAEGWHAIAPPAPWPVGYTLAPGTEFAQAINLTTGEVLTRTGATVPVGEDPVAVIVNVLGAPPPPPPGTGRRFAPLVGALLVGAFPTIAAAGPGPVGGPPHVHPPTSATVRGRTNGVDVAPQTSLAAVRGRTNGVDVKPASRGVEFYG